MPDHHQATECLRLALELRLRAYHATRLYPNLGHATEGVMIDAQLAQDAAAALEAMADFRLENNTLRLGGGRSRR